MFDTRQLDDLVRKLFAALPQSLRDVERDVQQKFKDILQTTFARFDLVTREEFDIQVKVLARTREKLEQLQQRIEDMP